MIKKFETAFVQRGIAPEVGLNQEGRTTVCAALFYDHWDHTPEFFLKSEDEGLWNVVYEVEVTHPEIYAGTLEELHSSCIRAAKRKLREVGALKTFKTYAGLEEEFLVKIDE